MPYTDVDVDITVSKVLSYDDIGNKPTINDVVVEGNLTAEDLKLQPSGDYVTTEQQTELLSKKQNTLKAGQNITIDETDPENPVISASNEISTVVYRNVENKPTINGIEIKDGNTTLDELNIQPKGDYALKSDINTLSNDISNTNDDLNTLINQVDNQGQSLNGLNSAITNLSNTKADKNELLNYVPKSGGIFTGTLTMKDELVLESTSGQSSTGLHMSDDGLMHISSGVYLGENSQSSKGKVLFEQDKGTSNGVASLDNNGKIPAPQVDVVSVLKTVRGYDETKNQVLKNINGSFVWVEE